MTPSHRASLLGFGAVLVLLLIAAGWLLRPGPERETTTTDAAAARSPDLLGADAPSTAAAPDTAAPSAERTADPTQPRPDAATTGSPTSYDCTRWAFGRVVLQNRDQPAAGAHVEVHATHEDGRLHEFRGRADADGFFLVECTIPGSDASRRDLGFEWHQRLWAPGRGTNHNVPDLSDHAASEAVHTYFLSGESGVVRGRVVDEAGTPVLGAELSIRQLDARGTTVGWGATANSDRWGRFELRYTSKGPHQIIAQHPAHGVARTPALDLDPLRDERAEDLALHGAGTISGRVQTPRGDPLIEWEITAIHVPFVDLEASGDDLVPAKGLDGFHELRLLQGDSGLVWTSTTTDENGAFQFEHLQPGDHILRLSTREGIATRRTRTGEDGVIVEAEHYEITVRLQDTEASVPAGVEPELHCQNLAVDARPRVETYFVDDSSPEDRRELRVRDGLVRIEVSADQDYELGVRGPQVEEHAIVLSDRVVVNVRRGHYRHELELPIRLDRGVGSLQVRAPELHEDDEIQLLVMKAESGSVFFETDHSGPEPCLLAAVPAGSYRVRATIRSNMILWSSSGAGAFEREERRRQEVVAASRTFLPFEDWYGHVSLATGFFLDAESTASVVPGEPTPISLRFPRGGRALVRLIADPEAPPPQGVPEHWTFPARAIAGDFDRPLLFGRVTPDDPEGSGIVFHGDSTENWWFVSELALPVGEVELQMDTPWGRFTRRVRIQEGALTPLELPLSQGR